MRKIKTVFVFLCISMTVNAKNDSNVDIEAIINTYSVQELRRGEFETTIEQNGRIAKFPSTPIVVKSPLEKGGLKYSQYSYDADKQELTFRLVGTSIIEPYKVFDSREKNAFLRGGYNMVSFYESPVKKSEYKATNPMGASILVEQKSLDEHSLAFSNLLAFENVSPPERIIKASPDEAKNIIKNAEWRLTVKPVLLPGQSNFILDGSFHMKPTFQYPYESLINRKVLMGDLLKAEVVESNTGKAIAEFLYRDVDTSGYMKNKVKLGVVYIPLNSELVKSLGIQSSDGVIVQNVMPNSSADKAGIKPMDIILTVNGKKVESTVTSLATALSSTEVGQKVDFGLIRNGKEEHIIVKF